MAAVPTGGVLAFASPAITIHPRAGIRGHGCPSCATTSPLRCWAVGLLLRPALGTSTLTLHPSRPQCHQCRANPVPAGAPTLQSDPPRAISYFFLNAPKPPVCFFNCSNHKREVSERYEPSSTGKGESPRRCRPSPRHRDGGASPARSRGWWQLYSPSPSPRPSSPAPFLFEVVNLGLVWCRRRDSGPPSADRSLCSLPLAFFSVCLQPLEGSCDESSLDRFQEQLKRSPGWGWEWEGSGAGQHQNAKWCSGQSWDGGTGSRGVRLEEKRGMGSNGSASPKLWVLWVSDMGTLWV